MTLGAHWPAVVCEAMAPPGNISAEAMRHLQENIVADGYRGSYCRRLGRPSLRQVVPPRPNTIITRFCTALRISSGRMSAWVTPPFIRASATFRISLAMIATFRA